MAAALQEKLQTASAEFQRIQAELASVVDARQKLDAQLSENELVKKEFLSLTEQNTVYKLVGPVLVRQDQAEAKHNVDTRLDFIRSEITRVEGQLKDLGDKGEKKKVEVCLPSDGACPPVLTSSSSLAEAGRDSDSPPGCRSPRRRCCIAYTPIQSTTTTTLNCPSHPPSPRPREHRRSEIR
ncbi:Prefoldin [Trametes elegans]|nr:Prefoldin [Trametes elegans]